MPTQFWNMKHRTHQLVLHHNFLRNKSSLPLAIHTQASINEATCTWIMAPQYPSVFFWNGKALFVGWSSWEILKGSRYPYHWELALCPNLWTVSNVLEEFDLARDVKQMIRGSIITTASITTYCPCMGCLAHIITSSNTHLDTRQTAIGVI